MKFIALLGAISTLLFSSPVMFLSAEEVVTEPGIEETTETTEEEEVEPTEEVLPEIELTEEELDALITEKIDELVTGSIELVAGTWESFITILGVSSLGGVLVLVHYVLKRLGLYGGLLDDTGGIIKGLSKQVEAERTEIQEVRKSFIALITMLNIDPPTKVTLIEKLGEDHTVEEFIEIAKELQVEDNDQTIEEVESLLAKVTEEDKK